MTTRDGSIQSLPCQLCGWVVVVGRVCSTVLELGKCGQEILLRGLGLCGLVGMLNCCPQWQQLLKRFSPIHPDITSPCKDTSSCSGPWEQLRCHFVFSTLMYTSYTYPFTVLERASSAWTSTKLTDTPVGVNLCLWSSISDIKGLTTTIRLPDLPVEGEKPGD